MVTLGPPEIATSVAETLGSLTTTSRIAPPCMYTELTDNCPSVAPKSAIHQA